MSSFTRGSASHCGGAGAEVLPADEQTKPWSKHDSERVCAFSGYSSIMGCRTGVNEHTTHTTFLAQHTLHIHVVQPFYYNPHEKQALPFTPTISIGFLSQAVYCVCLCSTGLGYVIRTWAS